MPGSTRYVGLALLVHEEALRRAAGRIGAVPDAIAILVADCLGPFEFFGAFELGVSARRSVGKLREIL